MNPLPHKFDFLDEANEQKSKTQAYLNDLVLVAP
jgi:hypothetical protein